MKDLEIYHIPFGKGATCSFSYDDFFLIFFCVYASQFYDAFAFYRKA
jgi:hypothetical protein